MSRTADWSVDAWLIKGDTNYGVWVLDNEHGSFDIVVSRWDDELGERLVEAVNDDVPTFEEACDAAEFSSAELRWIRGDL